MLHYIHFVHTHTFMSNLMPFSHFKFHNSIHNPTASFCQVKHNIITIISADLLSHIILNQSGSHYHRCHHNATSPHTNTHPFHISPHFSFHGGERKRIKIRKDMRRKKKRWRRREKSGLFTPLSSSFPITLEWLPNYLPHIYW